MKASSVTLTSTQEDAKGFTFIEVLVVLAIVAIITMVAVLTVHTVRHHYRLQLVLQQLHRVVAAARDRAILQPAILGLVATEAGYRFYEYKHDDRLKTEVWLPLSEDHLSHPTAFAGLAAWKMVAKNDAFAGAQSRVHPLIVFLPEGEVTPFKITLKDTTGKIWTWEKSS